MSRSRLGWLLSGWLLIGGSGAGFAQALRPIIVQVRADGVRVDPQGNLDATAFHVPPGQDIWRQLHQLHRNIRDWAERQGAHRWSMTPPIHFQAGFGVPMETVLPVLWSIGNAEFSSVRLPGVATELFWTGRPCLEDDWQNEGHPHWAFRQFSTRDFEPELCTRLNVFVAPSGVWTSWHRIWDSIECHGDWHASTAQALALEVEGDMPLLPIDDALASTPPGELCLFATLATRKDVAWGVVADAVSHISRLGYSYVQILPRDGIFGRAVPARGGA